MGLDLTGGKTGPEEGPLSDGDGITEQDAERPQGGTTSKPFLKH